MKTRNNNNSTSYCSSRLSNAFRLAYTAPSRDPQKVFSPWHICATVCCCCCCCCRVVFFHIRIVPLIVCRWSPIVFWQCGNCAVAEHMLSRCCSRRPNNILAHLQWPAPEWTIDMLLWPSTPFIHSVHTHTHTYLHVCYWTLNNIRQHALGNYLLDALNHEHNSNNNSQRIQKIINLYVRHCNTFDGIRWVWESERETRAISANENSRVNRYTF